MQDHADIAAFSSEELRASPEERRRWLLERLRRDGRLVAGLLARELGTSEDTIRRDLRELAAAGMVQRVHGGALPPSPALLPFTVRRERSTAAKERLAAEAVKLVRPDQVILLDGGTTNLALARLLPPALRLTVVTPSPAVAVALAEHAGAEVIVLGGRVDKASQSVASAVALTAAQAIQVDLCILGVCSLAAEVGVSVAGYEEAELKRVMVAHARDVAAIVTADKLGTVAPFVVGPVEILHRIVTEREAPQHALDAIAARGVEVLRV
jgi:DeoR/GlpR family transcriptional regulator of sugar metabolism